MGSAGLAGWIALIAFWVLVAIGWDELGPKRAAVFVIFFFAGFLGRAYVPYGAALFSSYLAVLDIALVFVIFKGDVRLH